MSIQDFALQGDLKVCIFILYMIFLKSECQSWRRPNKQKKHSPILLFNIYKEAELQKGKGIFRAGGGVGTKI